jgi:hypothetical protein
MLIAANQVSLHCYRMGDWTDSLQRTTEQRTDRIGSLLQM